MVTENTIMKLHEMKLGEMAQAFQNQLVSKAFYELSFEERFGMLVDQEWTDRQNKRLVRLIREAGYAISSACVEDIEYLDDRQLDKTQIMRLASCTYIHDHHNIIILGATGSGKTYLSNALGMAASRNLLPVRYIRLPDLLGDLALARSDGTFRKRIKQYKQVKLLILDEWLLFPLKETEARDLLEIVEARYKTASTIFCSQFLVEGWHEKIGDPTLADAIADRIVHDSYQIEIKGKDSMRRRKGILEAVAEA
jgi:DNA replication protein DnaC